MMIGLGLSIAGAAASQQMGPVFRTSLSSGLLRPHRDWAGIPNSGFTVTPTDPVRTTAKPILRLVTAPMVTVTDETVVGAMAVANDGGTLIGGIDRVRFHFEGSVMDVFAPTFRTFTRRDGSTYQQIGYWVTLQKPVGTEGEALLYVEAIPTDATMQRRVIGPYRYFLYDAEFTHQVTLNPAAAVVAGSNYQDIFAALNYLRGQNALRSRILGYGATHTLPNSALFASAYTTGQSCVVEWNEPVVISQTNANKGEFRTRWGGMIFRGENITFDMRYISQFNQEPTGHPAIFDRVRFTSSGGRYELWNKGFRPQGRVFAPTDLLGSWLLDCAFDKTSNSAMSAVNLVRGCTFDNVAADVFTVARCVSNCRVDDMDSRPFRVQTNAMTVAGPAGATLSLSGVSDANGRVFTARVSGTTVGTFTVNTTQAALNANTNWQVSHVVAWINSLGAGWRATTLDETRRAAALGVAGGTGNEFTNLDVSTEQTLVTMLDAHPDWYSTIGGSLENVLVMDNISTNIVTQIVFLASTTVNDAAFINNAWGYKVDALGGAQLSQFSSPQSHVVCVHNTCPDQNWLIRMTGGVGGMNYTGDAYCLFANNLLRDASHTGGSPTNEILAGQHYLTGALGFGGETGDTNGGTRDNLFVNISAGDFTPAGELRANLKPAVWAWDMHGNPRGQLASAGAVA